MNILFADRITGVPPSFIREILKVSLDPEIISFAGGLPNKALFPVQQIKQATEKVFATYGQDCFQYGNSEGFLKLRELIASRYKQQKNIEVSADNIFITNGAQQGLDLLGKVLLNRADGVVIEQPGYLGALQAFSIYRPVFLPYDVTEHGVDHMAFMKAVENPRAKLIYCVPNFQNPSGLTYSRADREKMCKNIGGKQIFLIEDDPYGELRFHGSSVPSFHSILPDQTILLGSFSKTVIPGFRIGWIVAPPEIMQKILIAKQAADLHTCHFTQYIFYHYMMENDIDEHIRKITEAYGKQCQAMIEGLDANLADCLSFTRPEGGMFLWGKLIKGGDAMALFQHAVEKKVVFVPGAPFYADTNSTPDFRMSFSCVDEATIDEGIRRLQQAVYQYLDRA